MKGTISSFRRGRTTQTDNQMIIHVEKSESKEAAQKLVGKKVVFKTDSGKEIVGEVKAAHGNSGAVRATFEKGMPGQSLGKPVSVQ